MRRWHPDRNRGREAEANFWTRRIGAANDILMRHAVDDTNDESSSRSPSSSSSSSSSPSPSPSPSPSSNDSTDLYNDLGVNSTSTLAQMEAALIALKDAATAGAAAYAILADTDARRKYDGGYDTVDRDGLTKLLASSQSTSTALLLLVGTMSKDSVHARHFKVYARDQIEVSEGNPVANVLHAAFIDCAQHDSLCREALLDHGGRPGLGEAQLLIVPPARSSHATFGQRMRVAVDVDDCADELTSSALSECIAIVCGQNHPGELLPPLTARNFESIITNNHGFAIVVFNSDADRQELYRIKRLAHAIGADVGLGAPPSTTGDVSSSTISSLVRVAFCDCEDESDGGGAALCDLQLHSALKEERSAEEEEGQTGITLLTWSGPSESKVRMANSFITRSATTLLY